LAVHVVRMEEVRSALKILTGKLFNIRIYTVKSHPSTPKRQTTILAFVLYGYDTWSLTLRE
jgi:hypothetical protein